MSGIIKLVSTGQITKVRFFQALASVEQIFHFFCFIFIDCFMNANTSSANCALCCSSTLSKLPSHDKQQRSNTLCQDKKLWAHNITYYRAAEERENTLYLPFCTLTDLRHYVNLNAQLWCFNLFINGCDCASLVLSVLEKEKVCVKSVK